jgi:hypothetical protein
MISCESADVEKQEFPFRNYFVPLPALRPREGSNSFAAPLLEGVLISLQQPTNHDIKIQFFLIEIVSLTSQCLSLNFVFNI